MKSANAVAVALGFVCGIAESSAAPPQQIAELRLDTPGGQASPAFLSDDTLGLLIRPGPPNSARGSTVMLLRLVDGKLQKAAATEGPEAAEHIFAASDRRILVQAHRGITLYSPDLRFQWQVPMNKRHLARFFPRTRVVGLRDVNAWSLIELGHDMPVLKTGSGYLLSVSNDALVREQDGKLQVEALDGLSLGSLKAPSRERGPIAEIAGSNRIFLDFGRAPRMVDFHGNVVLRLPDPPGWGFQYGWSSDGRRVLFDRFTRTASPAERTIDAVASILVPVPEEDNGEIIIAVDAATGKTCFRLESPHGKLFGMAGQMNADISPDGRLVAVATLDRLSIYRLPETCDAQ